jgi:hypothetical protein
LTKKRFVHKSEIPELLKGHIDGHKCKIYEATGLPMGMIEGTTAENFIVYRGGYNCGHELIPVNEAAVPKEIRAKFSSTILSKEDLSKNEGDTFSLSDVKNAGEIITKFSAYFKQTTGYDTSVNIIDSVASETYLKNNFEQLIKLSEEYRLNIPIEKISIQKMNSFGEVEDLTVNGKDYKNLRLNGKNATYEEIVRKLYSNADDDNIKYTNATHEFAHLLQSESGRTNANWKQEEEFLAKRQAIWDEYKGKLKSVKDANRKSQKWYIGEYGSKDIEDFMAECFSEYKLSSNPTKYAKQMGELIDKYFKK